MVIVALSFAGLALSLTAQFPPAEQRQAVVARPNPLDAGAVWSAAQGGASATDSQRGWNLAVSERGLRVSPLDGSTSAEDPAWSFEIGTASFGRMGAAQAVTLGQPAARGERVDLDHGSLSEWFVRGEHGVEHGWTIPAAPEGDAKAPLWIGLHIAGDLSMHIVDDGSGAFLRDARGSLRLRYTDLVTFDASGRLLPSKLMASPFGVGIQVGAQNAAFPITVDPVVQPPNWTFSPGQAGATLLGWDGKTAGDVNGDGFSDIILTAAAYDEPAGADTGHVWVFYGHATGPSLSPDWEATGASTPGGAFGADAAGVGDVNGDGYDDIAVTAPTQGGGKLFLYFGSATGLGPTGDPTNADFVYTGQQLFGFQVNPAGDVNGDGYADVIVDAEFEDVGVLVDAGRAYVFLGGPSGPVISATNPWIQNGTQNGGQFGRGATAGDVNADGYSDIVIGELGYNGSAGRAFVFHGGVNFASDHAADWERNEGSQPGMGFGYSVCTAGDVDGDGYSDVIVGSGGMTLSQTFEGAAFVYKGNFTGLSTTLTPLWYGQGNAPSAFYGKVSTAGDVDGDGFADVIVGAHAYAGTGAAFLVHGGASGLGPSGVSGHQQIVSPQAGSAFGSEVWSAGDVNGDGLGDVIVSAPQYNGNAGYFQVNLGSPAPQASLLGGYTQPLVEPGPLQAGTPSSRTGRSVSSAGDVNADGFNDIIVGSPEFGATDNGRVQVFLGSANGLNLATPFWTLDSPNTGERFGWSVSAGDIDNDGKSDIVVGAPRYSLGQTDEGRVYVFKSTGAPITTFTPTWSFESNQAGALFGSAVSALGDVNADGFSDIAVGAPGATSSQGSVTIFHGRATSLASIAPAITITSGVPGSEFGSALALVGDLNLDGFGDLVVGAPKLDNPQVDEGRIYVYVGSYTGISSTPAGQEESQQAGAMLGSSIAQCGDINGDGRAEVLVGAPGYDAATSGGAAFLFRNQSLGSAITLVLLDAKTGAQANSQYGLAVSAGGDVNGDGWSDVLVGAPDFDGNLSNQGRIYLYLGSSTGLATSPSETYDGPLANARLGESIALGGDVNGDGLSDPIGGVPSANNDDGGVIPLTGGGVTSWRVTSSQRQVSDTQALQILGRTNELNQFQINLGLQNGAGNTATAMGRAPVKLEWEIQPVGTTLNGSAIQAQVSFLDSGALGAGLRLSKNVTGLLDGTAYHWRARTVVRNPYYPHTRWTTIQLDGLQEKKLGMSADCNNDGIGDTIDLALATSLDCNADTIPDECQVPPLGSTFADCNANLVPDPCEYSPLFDCDSNGILDECQIPPFGSQDCNANSIVDTCDIASSFSLDTNGDAIPDECQLLLMAGANYCFGDGTGAACPCANSSPVGNQEGCLNSLGTAGRLRATGIARVQAPFDNFTLIGTGMPNSSALYFQGTTQQSSGNGAIFGDGKRCAAGSVVRLATKINSAGASQYPVVGDLPISVKGLLPAGGGTRTYQIWYRNAAAFCTASTFNLSNGFRVTWIP
ncbi:MAG: FG-GAP-like repeat-containing protein [Planctomycetota bacterium]|nr:FG-GAP-like repeat-containing protein [Planctomycetota bacterium]